MVIQTRIRIITLAVAATCMAGLAGTTAMAAELPATSLPSVCKQLGGERECKLAVAGAWTYRIKDLYNDMQYPTEAAAYAYLMRVREARSVFALAYRWTTADSAGFPTIRQHSIEASSWKVFERCAPGDDEFACDRRPERMAYQRTRQVTCPAGYRFSSDQASPYCIAWTQPDAPALASR